MKPSHPRRLRFLVVATFGIALGDLLVLDLLVAPRALEGWAEEAGGQPAPLSPRVPSAGPDAARPGPTAAVALPEPPDAAEPGQLPPAIALVHPADAAIAVPGPEKEALPVTKTMERPKPPPLPDPILFEDRSSKLADQAQSSLDRIVRAMRSAPHLRLVVQGHADERGPKTGNENISRSRALMVERYLVEAGVDPSRLEIRAFGSDRPIDTRSTPDAWARNRRVDFVWKEPLQ